MPAEVELEVCVESVESARAAEQGSAARVELCSALIVGGLTPSAGLIARVRRSIQIALHVLIRPRTGDFCYSSDQIDVMQRDILLARQLGANGVALGILDLEGNIDVARTRGLVERAAPMQVTFHRAFDFVPKPIEALQAAIATGATRILTSGGAPTAQQGAAVLRKLVQEAGSRVAIMAAGKVRENNVATLMKATGVREVHANLAVPVGSVRQVRCGPSLGQTPESGDSHTAVSAEAVASFLRAAKGTG